MTEPERIISEGILPASFLEPEVRCGYEVTTERKQVWAVLIDLLLQFDAVCKKHNFHWFFMGGSLLGAIRHEGFIPWDDDMDVCLMRDEYEEFLKCADEFKGQYFLQTPFTDPYSYYGMAKLRNDRTTWIADMYRYCPFNKGIALDIIPLDPYDKEDGRIQYERISNLNHDTGTYYRLDNPNLSETDKMRVYAYRRRCVDPKETWREVQSIAMKYRGLRKDHILAAVTTNYPFEKNLFTAVDFDRIVTHKFEGFNFNIPAGYDSILRNQYGDYMEFPPPEKRGAWHDNTVVDANTPWRESLKTHFGIEFKETILHTWMHTKHQTECERIVQEGVLPSDFFKPEDRCGFHVDERRKKIWGIELDMLLQLDRVCKRHGLQYFLIWGSLLGAVRHKGFIPWDDDMDVILPRKDFQKLMELGNEFKAPYFLQTPYSDRGFAFSHYKLRNSNTCNFPRPRSYWGFNCGIFIDILPLDNIRVDGVEKLFADIKELNEYNSSWMKIPGYYMDDTCRERLRRHYGMTPIQAYDRITEIATQYNGEQTEYVSCNISSFSHWKRRLFKAEAFASSLEMDFEGLKVPVPVGYDHILSTHFGNYMQLPPMESRLSGHDTAIWQPDEPYKIHMARRGVRIWDK